MKAQTSFEMDGPASADDGIFGLPGSERAARLVYLPVPWEVTTSYGGGTSNGPSAIREASPQLDLYDEEVERPYAAGLYMRRESARVRRWNFEAKMAAQSVIASLTAGKKASPKALSTVNAFGDKLNAWVYEETRGIIAAGKVPALIGGDHSTPYGAIRAAVEKWPGLGLLHFDAHHDTREAYEGFTWSHASIFFNVMRRLPVRKIVQVGIRDYSAAERAFCRNLKDRCAVFYDEDLKRRRFSGEPFHTTAREIVSELPSDVWVTFDIDGLDPRYCPGTGTPVPGGLEFSEANHILRTLVASKRRIVGFDLNEVAPLKGSEWDANVGARLLYKMTAWTLASQGLAKSSLR